MSRFKTCLAALALALCATPSMAGVLATDFSSYLGIWNGSSTFSSVETDLAGYIDFAVYAPGDFPGGFGGYTPTPGEFVYTYQAFVTGPSVMSSVTVNLLNYADNPGTFTGAGVSGDSATLISLVNLDSAAWTFDGVPSGGSTVGLVFSSPYGPLYSTASFLDHGQQASNIPVPSPDSYTIPEPATFTLALAGLVGFAFEMIRRRSRRIRS